MKILGNRVYLNMPQLPDTSVKLLPETEQALKEEMREKFDRLTVFATFENSPVSVGDEVFVDPNAVRRAVIFKVNGEEKMCVNIFDIQHIW